MKLYRYVDMLQSQESDPLIMCLCGGFPIGFSGSGIELI